MIPENLAPVGNRITSCKVEVPFAGFENFASYWLGSGTMALALAMQACRQLRPELDQPELILPAYCCPDLVSAAVYAGLKPVIVDIDENNPGVNLSQLNSALNDNTIAVVAINFLGLQERIDSIKALLPNGVFLIEDCAQYFPEQELLPGKADFTVLSFGRGKPVSLLGGGALLIAGDLNARLDLGALIKDSVTDRLLAVKIGLYNFLLHPFIYVYISKNPLLKLGETVYKPLKEIKAMDCARQSLLGANIREYLDRSESIEASYRALLAKYTFLDDFSATHTGRKKRLLRYPLLCKTPEIRNELLSLMIKAGLGASTLYGKNLPNIQGLETILPASQLPLSELFASRLITLPLHGNVKTRHIKNLEKLLKFFEYEKNQTK